MRWAIAAGGILMTILGTRVAAADTPISQAESFTLPALPVPPMLAPLWPEEALPPRPARVLHRSVARMVTGIVITAVGGLVGVFGTGLAVTPNGLAAGLLMLPIGGIVLPGIGIPLWLSGSRSTYSWDEARSRPPGETGGPSSAPRLPVTIGWAF
jgi:hypothetical protein